MGKKDYITLLWLWLILLTCLIMIALMTIEQSKVIMTILGFEVIGATIVGVVIGIAGVVFTLIIRHYIGKWLNRPTMKPFKSHLRYDVNNDSNEFDKMFPLSLGAHIVYLFVYSSRTYDALKIIGIRPQRDKPWFKRWFRQYNNSTENIDLSTPPIIIRSLEDISLVSGKSFTQDVDDKKCGRFGLYEPSLEIVPTQYLTFKLEVEAKKIWEGYIDFRIDVKGVGKRVRHHPCRIIG